MNPSKEKEIFESRPVFRAIMNLAIPSILGQLILVIYNMADTFFVGLTNNDAMITAVTVCMPAFMFLSAISNLFGVGGASVISRALGKKDIDRSKHASQFAIFGCLITTIIYCLLSFLFINVFINLLGGKDINVHNEAKAYLIVAVVAGGIPTAMNTLFSHLIRSQGRSFQASIGIALGGILNIALDPLFMFVILDKGHEALGAGIATCISNVAALIYYLVLLIKDRKVLVVSAKIEKNTFNKDVMGSVIIIGIPACLMTLCENISYAILDNLMSGVNLAAQTGVGVAKKVNMLAHSLVRGMTQGVLPLIGYNKASGNRKRMKKVVFMSGAISIGISLLCMGCSIIFSRELTGLFIHNDVAEVGQLSSLDYGARFLQILCIGAPFSALAYTVISFFQAVGKAWRSLILALLRKGIVDIPLMFILRISIPTYGIVLATPIADFICSVIALILFLIYIKYHGQNKSYFHEEHVEIDHSAAIEGPAV